MLKYIAIFPQWNRKSLHWASSDFFLIETNLIQSVLGKIQLHRE